MLDLRERLLPEVDDEFAKSVGEVATVDELRTEIRDALGRRAQDEAGHAFADRIIDFAASNATVELPEVMITNEIEIMRDELRNRLAQRASASTSTWPWPSRLRRNWRPRLRGPLRVG